MCKFCHKGMEQIIPRANTCIWVCSDNRKNDNHGYGEGYLYRTAGAGLDKPHDRDFRQFRFFLSQGVTELWVTAHHDCLFAQAHGIADEHVESIIRNRMVELHDELIEDTLHLRVRGFIGSLRGPTWIYQEMSPPLFVAKAA